MLSAAIVIFREILEIALILSVVMAATRGLEGRNRWVLFGILGGVSGSAVVAVFAEVIANAAEGLGQELFNAAILLTASVVIGGTALWMSKHAREMTQHLRKISSDVIAGSLPLHSIAIVIALAVLREGAEIILFVHGMIASGQDISSIMAGSAAGFIGGAALGLALYMGLISISPKHIFGVTTWLLIFLCAGMSSSAAGVLVGAGWFSGLEGQVWDSSFILSDSSILGKTLHALFGYTSKPMVVQIVFYLVTIGVLLVAKKIIKSQPAKNLKAAAAVALLAVAVFSNRAEAHDFPKVYTPYVEKGHMDVEWRASRDSDRDDEKDDKQTQVLGFGYGFTDRFASEIAFELEKGVTAQGSTRDYKMTSVRWENIFQLTEKGQYWADFGLQGVYEQSFENDHANNIELNFLAAKDIGQTSHALNLMLSEEVGEHAEDGLSSGIAWSSKYRYSEYFEPGFEYHAEFGRFKDELSYNRQEHQFGPVIYGKLPYGFKYDIGYLFGISSTAPEHTFKSIIEYEYKF